MHLSAQHFARRLLLDSLLVCSSSGIGLRKLQRVSKKVAEKLFRRMKYQYM